MTRGLNKAMIIGSLARNPEMRITPSGKPVTTFSVGTSRTWNSSDGQKHTETEWFNIVAWGELADRCSQSLSKGQQVYIEGRLQTRKWEDTEGTKHSSIEIVASEMIMLDSRFENKNLAGHDSSQADRFESEDSVY